MSNIVPMGERIQTEQDLFQRLTRILTEVGELSTAFENAGIPVPPTLSRLLGEDGGQRGGGQMTPSFLKVPPRPREADSSWIWLPAADASAQTLAMAILRKNKGFIAPKDLAEAVLKINGNMNLRSVYNVGPRLIETGDCERSTDGKWRLVNTQSAPVLDGEYVWGSTNMLNKSEAAAHRRMLILALLTRFADGLQTVQIARELPKTTNKVTINKDLIKQDMEALSGEGRVRRLGRTRKWRLKNEGGAA